MGAVQCAVDVAGLDPVSWKDAAEDICGKLLLAAERDDVRSLAAG
jgi:hypothetical protein